MLHLENELSINRDSELDTKALAFWIVYAWQVLIPVIAEEVCNYAHLHSILHNEAAFLKQKKLLWQVNPEYLKINTLIICGFAAFIQVAIGVCIEVESVLRFNTILIFIYILFYFGYSNIGLLLDTTLQHLFVLLVQFEALDDGTTGSNHIPPFSIVFLLLFVCKFRGGRICGLSGIEKLVYFPVIVYRHFSKRIIFVKILLLLFCKIWRGKRCDNLGLR